MTTGHDSLPSAQQLLLVLCLLLLTSFSHAQQPAADPWFGPSSKPRDFAVPKVQLGSYSIELPKDWQIGPGHAGILLFATERTGNKLPRAAIKLEHQSLFDAPTVTPEFGEAELRLIRQREPSGQGFTQQIKEGSGRRFVFIQYTRPGLVTTDSVVQYSIPVGAVMYRLICIAPQNELAIFQQIFAHVAASFRPAGGAPSKS